MADNVVLRLGVRVEVLVWELDFVEVLVGDLVFVDEAVLLLVLVGVRVSTDVLLGVTVAVPVRELEIVDDCVRVPVAVPDDTGVAEGAGVVVLALEAEDDAP